MNEFGREFLKCLNNDGVGDLDWDGRSFNKLRRRKHVETEWLFLWQNVQSFLN